ncbi:SDR family NAD(P)-dependent oxidoreductase [Tumebacillus permanentifrigoris]|uniref:Dihydroanticapsin dehydrogenase n=1 Tax=Tumebacillus permanentifrigoris TaxID=378543 RepID=A0A316E0W8_9BACL|nr:glucose 1-dehydrogenase [Tumebacillus permanentifrigoris]PWK16460.1 dihydroanticapsin dehydrogenase [Tumebacillus permanentifrigoris]
MRLSGKVAIVTGAARGIGAAIAQRFAEEGAQVVLADLLAEGAETARAIRESGGQAVFCRTDVSKSEEVQALISTAVETYGGLHILCNNAAVNIPGSILDISEEIWDLTMNVNLKGMFLVSKYGIPELKKAGGGSVVNIGSANSLVAEPLLSAYVTSKGGVLMLTKSMALDFAADNIRVNCVCPGWVDTTINDAHAELLGGREHVLAGIADFQPIGRMIQPREIANVALFLASDESSAMTGSAIVPDGGMTAK